MKKIQILNNQNKIYSEAVNQVNCVSESHEFSIRFVFNGNELYHIGNKELGIFPENFLVINEGTVYNRKINSGSPVNTLSILYTNQFLKSFRHSVTSSDRLLLDDPFSVPNNPAPVFLETIRPQQSVWHVYAGWAGSLRPAS